MRQINLPKKNRALIQVWVSILLIVLSIVFAFNPLLTLDLKDSSLANTVQDAMGTVGEVLDDDDIGDSIEIPDKVDVTTFKVINSAIVFGKFVSLSIETATNTVSSVTGDDENDSKLQDSIREMEELLKSKKGQEALLLGFGLAAQAIDLEDLLDGDDGDTADGVGDAYADVYRDIPDYSSSELTDILGGPYADGYLNDDRIESYLKAQARLYQDHKSLYLMDIGVTDEVENFSDLSDGEIFAQLKGLVEDYIAYSGISGITGGKVTYGDISALYSEFGSDYMDNIFRGMDFYLIDRINSLEEDFTVGVNSNDSEAERLADFLLLREIISYEEYLGVLTGDIEYDPEVDEYALKELLADKGFDTFEEFFENEGYAAVHGVKDDQETATTIGQIIKTVLSFVILLYIVIYVVVWPFIMLITGIVTLIKALINMKKPEEVAAPTAAKMLAPLTFTVATMLLLTFFPGVNMGWGLVVIFVLAIISVVTNVVISRLRAYNKGDFEYATLVQAGAGVEAIGLVLFLVGLLNTGFIRRLISTTCEYLVSSLTARESLNTEIRFYNDYFGTSFDIVPVNLMYLIDLVLVLAAAIMALSVVASLLKSIAGHLGLNKNVSAPGSLGNAIVALLVCILPLAASFLKSNVVYTMTAKGATKSATSLLVIGDSMWALVLMFVGAVILLGAAIAFRIVKQNLCPAITPEQEKLILTGNAPEFGTVAEEATAEETVEATAEENGEVEAPTEEVPAEEASAEEAPAEEAPAESDEA